MDDKDLDVELERLLSGSEPDSTPGASTGTEQPENVSKDVKTVGLSERATSRIRDLVRENNELKSKSTQAPSKESNGSATEQPTDIDSVLETLGVDEASRKVLKAIAQGTETRIESKYKPFVSQIREMQFNSEFAQIAQAAPELAAHRDQILKTFRANPDTNLRALAGETLLEVRRSQVKPLESQRSQPDRDASSDDLDGKSVDELFEILANSRK